MAGPPTVPLLLLLTIDILLSLHLGLNWLASVHGMVGLWLACLHGNRLCLLNGCEGLWVMDGHALQVDRQILTVSWWYILLQVLFL